MSKLFLLRYDTESGAARLPGIGGFLEKAVEVHRKHAIPATFFCLGKAIETREAEFRAFFEEVKDDPQFDVQDHSYTHVGVGYRDGKPVDDLRRDYEQSLTVHERVFGRRPLATSLCGTSGKDGPRLDGFDATEKSRAELDMLVDLGVRFTNALLCGVDETKEFVHFGRLGHPDVMGFPSGYSDTAWMHRREFGDPMDYILGQLAARAEREEHMPLMLHDWVAWLHAPDRELTHVIRIVEAARKLGYETVTHLACHENTSLWKT